MWREPSLEHVIALSDDVGIHQHATYDVPNRKEGYCTDDVARAFMLVSVASAFDRSRADADRLARTYLAFLLDAQMPDGRFHNFMSYARTWLDDVGSPDSNGRAIWALGHGSRFAVREGSQRVCADALERALPAVATMEFVRSRVYASFGLVHACEAQRRAAPRLEAMLRAIGDDLVARHAACSGRAWDWFENELTYDNARLPEALLRIGTVLDDSRYVDLGVRTLAFYESIVIEDGVFVPIGSNGWYVRGGERARYAQQPLEAAALVDAALAAEAATGSTRYRDLAETGFAWFDGRNTRGAVLASGGGCHDGLETFGVNANMGAESTLAYLASAFALAQSTATGTLQLVR
jgi:ATP-dependent protease HslVU (ClpYQ) peptidase subunit